MIITANTEELANYNRAANGILSLIDDFGFTTNKVFDLMDLKDKIVGTIIANVHVNEIIDVEAQEPTEADLEELLDELAQEGEQQQLHANECPACGQLVR